MYDLIIIGGGPAGLTAAVYAARKKLGTLLIAKDIGGQVLRHLDIENYMGYQYIEGPELVKKFHDQVAQFPIEQKVGEEAVSLSRTYSAFEVRTAEGATYQARSVIVATGKRPRQLNVPGEELLIGRGVTYCAVCDGPLFAGEKVVIVGGGNSALEAADDMSKLAQHVYLVSIVGFTGDPLLVDRVTQSPNLTVFLFHEVVRIEGKNRVEAMVIRDKKTGEEKKLEVGGILVEIGLLPNSGLVKGLLTLNKYGEIEVNCATETSVPGLFAAGDVTNVPEKQIVVAAGEGAKAALAANRHLMRQKTSAVPQD